MSPRSSPAVALIIDQDLGFLMWLGDLFATLGWQAIPALNCRQALAYVKRMELPIRTLVIDPRIRGAGRLLQHVLNAHPNTRVILIRDSDAFGDEPGNAAQHYSVLERPSSGATISHSEWLDKVREALARSSTGPLY